MNFATLTLAELQSAYEATTPETEELHTLIAGIQAERRLRFSSEDAEAAFPTLLAVGQLAPDGVITKGTQIAIADTPLLYCGIYQIFGSQYHYTVSGDLQAAYGFLEQIHDFLFEHEGIFGANKLIKGLMEWLLHFSIKEYSADLPSFVIGHSFKTESPLNGTLLESLLHSPFLSSLPINQFWPVARHLVEEIGEPEAGVHSPTWNHLQGVVQTYARAHPDQAAQIKQLAIEGLPTRPVYFISLAALVGLWESGYFLLAEMLGWLDLPEKRLATLTIMRILPFQTATDRQTILEKLASITLSPDELYNLPTLYVNFLNAAEASESSVIQQCNAGLKAMLESKDPGNVRVCLAAINRLKNDVTTWMDHFIEITRAGRYHDSYTPLVNGLFGTHPIAEKFAAFIAAYAVNKEPWISYEPFEYALHFLQHTPAELDEALICLMINDHGQVRWAGHQLYYSKFQHGQRATVAYDILKLSEEEQRKLAVSLLQPFQPVELTIPPCIPLLRSLHLSVRQLVKQRLLDLTNSYRNEVVEEVSSLLPADFPDRCSIIDPLQVANDALLAETQRKVAILELDPRQTNPAQVRTYLQGFQQRARQSFRMARKRQGGIMAIAHEVPVNRGGGWKPTGSAQVQALGSFPFEVSLSRMGFLRPEGMDEQYHDLFSADWQNNFDTWALKTY